MNVAKIILRKKVRALGADKKENYLKLPAEENNLHMYFNNIFMFL